MNRQTTGILLSLGAVFGSALSIFLCKFALNLLPLSIVLFGGALTMILSMLPFEIRYLRRDFSVSLKIIIPIALIYLLGNLALLSSIKHLNPVTVGLVSRLYVVFTTLFALYSFREKLDKKLCLLIMLAIFGGALFIFRENQIQFYMFYIFLALLSSFMFATANAVIKKNHLNFRVTQLLLYINFIGFISYGSYLIFHLGDFYANYTFTAVFFTVTSMLCFAASMFSYVKSFQYLPFWQVNVFSLLSPLILAVISWPFFTEHFTVMNLVGGAVVIVSLAILGKLK